MNAPNDEFHLISHFYNGLWGAEDKKRLKLIGDELYKVRNYANKYNIDTDLFTLTVCYLTLSSYYAGLVPIVQIEGALFVAKEFRNEYAYALSVRAYFEVAGRLHKGMCLWRQFQSEKKTLEEFRSGVGRLMAKFQPKNDSPSGIFKGKGFNVMTLVKSLSDKIPTIVEEYEALSSYVHGGYEEQMSCRKASWFSDIKMEDNPVIAAYEKKVAILRAIVFEDFDELLYITQPLRKRYDNSQ